MSNLRTEIRDDVVDILEDIDYGISLLMNLINPDNLAAVLKGWSNDISAAIDPDTGIIVTGRVISVALPQSSILNAGFPGLPVGIQDDKKTPWIVQFEMEYRRRQAGIVVVERDKGIVGFQRHL